MSPPKQAYHHGDLRNALVAAAVRLIEASGHEGFSLREAAREVGVSANAAYRHFDDRSALLTAVARSGFEQLSRRMQRAINTVGNTEDAASAAVARFKAVGRAYVEFALKHRELFGVMFSASGVPQIAPEWAAAQAEENPSPYQLLGKALDELVVERVLAPADRPGAELKAWTVVHGFARLVLDGAAHIPSGAARTTALTSILDFAVAGLASAPPARE